jgi:hypothetical protein
VVVSVLWVVEVAVVLRLSGLDGLYLRDSPAEIDRES